MVSNNSSCFHFSSVINFMRNKGISSACSFFSEVPEMIFLPELRNKLLMNPPTSFKGEPNNLQGVRFSTPSSWGFLSICWHEREKNYASGSLCPKRTPQLKQLNLCLDFNYTMLQPINALVFNRGGIPQGLKKWVNNIYYKLLHQLSIPYCKDQMYMQMNFPYCVRFPFFVQHFQEKKWIQRKIMNFV